MLDKRLANTLGRAIAPALATAARAQAAETDVKTMSTIRVQEDEDQGTAVAGHRSKRAEQIGPLVDVWLR